MRSLRENPERAVFLNQSIGRELYNEVFPKIINLQNSSSEPICIYLDSFGGSVGFAEKLRELLKRPNQDGESCFVISVVPSIAASAAADLTILSDYAIAYPEAIIHCHGSSLGDNALTEENIKDREEHLKLMNREHAVKLASQVCIRIARRLSDVVPKEEGYDIEDLITKYYKSCLGKLSKQAKEFVEATLESWESRRALTTLMKEVGDDEYGYAKFAIDSLGQFTKEDSIIKGINSNIVDIIEHVKSVIERYQVWVSIADNGITPKMVDNASIWLLSKDEFAHVETLKDDGAVNKFVIEKSLPYVKGVWLYAFHFCDCLHKGENRFTSIDAFHLGLIDEVCGMDDSLPSYRLVEERQ